MPTSDPFEGLSEPEDYLTCRECGFRGKTLVMHLKKHGLNGKSYRAKYGADLPLRSEASEAKRRAGITKERRSRKGLTKVLPCSACRDVVEVSAYASTVTCEPCKTKAEEARWEGKTEPEDYVTCVECGHRAENLTSHIQNAHPTYREDHPEAEVVALNSAVRDKTALQGRTLSEETREKMSENAGRWNKGLTKEDHPSLAAQAEKMREKVPWNQGLSASGPDADPRLSNLVEKLKAYIGENRPWVNGLKADLTLDDFAPVLDEEGRVDRQRAIELLGFSWNTISKYMEEYGMELSDVNVQARHEAQIIRLAEEDLAPYRLKNGKLVVGWAASRLGRDRKVVAREADRLGIPRLKRIRQGQCLGAVSEALGGALWKEEWKDRRFVNPETGWRYRYDGFFKSHRLVVEFHGHQHFIFPNAFHATEEEFLALRERDRHKEKLIQEAPDLTYMMVRYDEPFTDASYLRGRLFALGIFEGGCSPSESARPSLWGH
jgi:predicted transcriptional regulator